MADPSSPTGVDRPEARVVVADEQASVAIDAHRWATLATAVLDDAGVSGELTLTFVDAAEIHELNREHMGHDRPTDVLSFPLDDAPDAVAVGPILLGDVVVCPEVAQAQAAEHAGTLDDELALLVVHGVLHVLGHDHAEPAETAVMRRREHELLTTHHWRGPAPTDFRHDHADTVGDAADDEREVAS